MGRMKWPVTYTRYFTLGMELLPALQSPFTFHLWCGKKPPSHTALPPVFHTQILACLFNMSYRSAKKPISRLENNASELDNCDGCYTDGYAYQVRVGSYTWKKWLLCSSEKRDRVLCIHRLPKHLSAHSAATTAMSSSSRWTFWYITKVTAATKSITLYMQWWHFHEGL